MTAPGPDFEDLIILEDQVLPVNKFDWLSGAQFVIGLISALLFLGAAVLGGLVLLLGDQAAGGVPPVPEALSSWLLIAGVGFGGLLTLPSTYFAGLKLLGKESREAGSWILITRISAFFPILIWLGYQVQTGPAWSKAFLPLLHILTNGLILVWVWNLVYRKLPGGSAQRRWGFFSAGLTVIPLISFLIEVLILLFLGLVWVIALQTQPGFQDQLLLLVEQLQTGDPNLEMIQNSLEGFINRPGLILTGFAYLALLVPLVEETLKPVLIWLLFNRKPEPRDGFLLGAASGAGYALFENLTIGASADIWTVVIFTRLGTVALHILTSGTVGWGIASAISEKKYLRLGGAFLAAVVLHGVWNGLNIFTALAELPALSEGLGGFWSYFADYANVGLVILALGSFGGLFRANSWFSRAIITQSPAESEVEWKSLSS